MLIMENSEEVLQILERYSKLKPKDIPKELEDYLSYVAKTGDTVYRWSHVKHLFREKLIRVIKDFHESTPSIEDLPQYPNVDPFNYESMKSALLERLELFSAAPFTVQRLCELLTDPRKQYSRIDKYMRALEKNILVVSTIEPGRKPVDSENGDSLDSVVNGDLSLDVNVEVDMEGEHLFNIETANTSADDVNEPKTADSANEDDTTNTRLENGDDDKKMDTISNERLDVDILSSSESDSNKEKSENEVNQTSTEEKPEKDKSTEKEISEENLDERLEGEPKTEDKSQEEKDTNLTDDAKDTNHSAILEKDKINSPEKKAETTQNDHNENGEETETWKPATTSPPETDCQSPSSEERKVEENQPNVEPPCEQDEAAHCKSEEPIRTESPTKATSSEFEVSASGKADEESVPDIDAEVKARKVQEQMAIEEMSAPLLEEPTCNALLQPIADTTTPQVIPDQPMDDNLENTPPVPTSSCLNEVVMQSETEMATDSDNVKAEAAVMDIDDTSQEEAMDQ